MLSLCHAQLGFAGCHRGDERCRSLRPTPAWCVCLARCSYMCSVNLSGVTRGQNVHPYVYTGKGYIHGDLNRLNIVRVVQSVNNILQVEHAIMLSQRLEHSNGSVCAAGDHAIQIDRF